MQWSDNFLTEIPTLAKKLKPSLRSIYSFLMKNKSSSIAKNESSLVNEAQLRSRTSGFGAATFDYVETGVAAHRLWVLDPASI